MCGRYARKSAQELLAEWFDLDLSIMPWFAPSYNVAPQSFQPVVLLSRDGSQREAAMHAALGIGAVLGQRRPIGLNTVNAAAASTSSSSGLRTGSHGR
jgi:putative SOS response-associated peptidase YedK